MIANIEGCAGAAISGLEMRNSQVQCHEGQSPGSLIERVCSFLDKYPLSRADKEGLAPSVSIEAAGFCRIGDNRRED
jgi:hypothetical protein